MNLYETTFIINPQTDDATIDRHVREVASLINDNEGRIRYEDHMGTRRLAYEIQGLNQGYYASFIFEAPTSVLPKLTRHFKLNEPYIRHLTVRFEGDLDKLIGPEEEAPEKASEKAPEKAEEKPAEAAAPAAEAAETPAETTEPAAETAEPEKTVEPEGADETAEIPVQPEAEEKPAAPEAADEEEEL